MCCGYPQSKLSVFEGSITIRIQKSQMAFLMLSPSVLFFFPTSQKPRGAPAAQNEICPPAKVRPNPVKIKCSQLAQSCLPQSGCCDPCATCHCRFFNVICFCRKTKSQSEKNRQKETPHHIKSQTKNPTHATGHWPEILSTKLQWYYTNHFNSDTMTGTCHSASILSQ